MQSDNTQPEGIFFELMKRIRKLDLDTHSLEDGASSPAQMALLDWISTNPGCSVQDIANGLGLASPTISVGVRKMEKSGKAERKPNPLDGRSVQFFLTKRGQAIQEMIQNSHRKKFHHLLAGLSQQEQEKLLELLERAVQSAERAGPDLRDIPEKQGDYNLTPF
jgi:DNA-binding MarR family transcriptional regulator